MLIIACLCAVVSAQLIPDPNPSNIYYHGFWHSCFKTPKTHFLTNMSGGFDHTDTIEDLVNYYIFWEQFHEYPESNPDSPDTEIDEGYGFESLADKYIKEKQKQIAVSPFIRGTYPNSGTTPVIMNEARDQDGNIRPWKYLEDHGDYIGGNYYTYAFIQKIRFKLLWTGWDGNDLSSFPGNLKPTFRPEIEFRADQSYVGFGYRIKPYHEHISLIDCLVEPYSKFFPADNPDERDGPANSWLYNVVEAPTLAAEWKDDLEFLNNIPKRVNFNILPLLMHTYNNGIVKDIVPDNIDICEFNPFFAFIIRALYDQSGTSGYYDYNFGTDSTLREAYTFFQTHGAPIDPFERMDWLMYNLWVDNNGFRENFKRVCFDTVMEISASILSNDSGGKPLFIKANSTGSLVKLNGFYYREDHAPNAYPDVPFQCTKWYYDFACEHDNVIGLEYYMAGDIKYGKPSFYPMIKVFLDTISSDLNQNTAIDSYITECYEHFGVPLDTIEMDDVFLLGQRPDHIPDYDTEGTCPSENDVSEGFEILFENLDWFRLVAQPEDAIVETEISPPLRKWYLHQTYEDLMGLTPWEWIISEVLQTRLQEIAIPDNKSADDILEVTWNILKEIYFELHGSIHPVFFDGLGKDYTLQDPPAPIGDDIHLTLRYFYYLLSQSRYYDCPFDTNLGDDILKHWLYNWPPYLTHETIGAVHLDDEYGLLQDMNRDMMSKIKEHHFQMTPNTYYFPKLGGMRLQVRYNNPNPEFQGNIYYRLTNRSDYSEVAHGLPFPGTRTFDTGVHGFTFSVYSPLNGLQPGWYDYSASIRTQPVSSGATFCMDNGVTSYHVKNNVIPGRLVVKDDISSNMKAYFKIDLNSDDAEDVVGKFEGQVVILVAVQEENSELYNTGQYLGENVREIAISSFDADFSSDLMIENDSGAELYRNDGTGIMSLCNLIDDPSFRDAEVMDIDKDGLSDIVFASSSKIIVSKNTGGCNFQDIQTLKPTGSVWILDSADIDGDADTDLVAGTSKGAPVITNDGTGDLEKVSIIPSGNTKALVLGDLNGDGFPEVVTGSPSGENEIWENDGQGGFSDSGQAIDTVCNAQILIEDINEDGCPDIVMSGMDCEVVFYNDCTGNFDEEPPPTPTPTPEYTPQPTPTPSPYTGPDFFVDINTGSDVSGDGSPGYPWSSIHHAVDSIVGTESNPLNIHLSPGTYDEGAVVLNAYESLSGADSQLTTVTSDALFGTIAAYSGCIVENLTVHNSVHHAIRPNDDSAVRYCVIDGKQAGVYLNYGSTAEIEHNAIIMNDSHSGIECWDSVSPVIRHNVISGNGSQGILINDQSNAVIFYNLITENVQSGILVNSTGNIEIFFNTIHNNGYDGVLCVGDSTPVISHNIIVVNGEYGIECLNNAVPNLSFNNVWGNTWGDYYGCSPGPGDISADPGFVSGSLGDYYLIQVSAGQSVDSPCVDAGDSGEMPFGTTRTDHVPDAGIVDIGFHYSP